MRLATMMGIAVLAASTAALAQVASSPVEQKTQPTNAAAPSGKDTEGLDSDAVTGPGNVMTDTGNTNLPTPERTPTPRPR